MRKWQLFFILFLLKLLFIQCIIAQDVDSLGKIYEIINLQEVTVYPKTGLKVIEPKSNLKTMHISGRGNTSIVTIVQNNEKDSITIKSIEFFFNYKWRDIDREGFIIRPLILCAKKNYPDSALTEEKLYFVGNTINEVIHIELQNRNVKIEPNSNFFIGLEFYSSEDNSNLNDFNVTTIQNKNKMDNTYIKGNCSKCTYSPFNLTSEDGITLKYKIYYTLSL